MFKKGFTLIEILVSMALVGVLVMVLTPNIAKLMPDKEKAMFIKAYTRTEMAVANMINDPEMYPTKFDITETKNGNLAYSQFGLCSDADVTGVLKANNDFTDTVSERSKKFHFYFAQELGTNYSSGDNIETNDGLVYQIKRTADKSDAQLDAVAATITIALQSDVEPNGNIPTDKQLGEISVKNDGAVECGDQKCKAHLADRYNLKKDMSASSTPKK